MRLLLIGLLGTCTVASCSGVSSQASSKTSSASNVFVSSSSTSALLRGKASAPLGTIPAVRKLGTSHVCTYKGPAKPLDPALTQAQQSGVGPSEMYYGKPRENDFYQHLFVESECTNDVPATALHRLAGFRQPRRPAFLHYKLGNTVVQTRTGQSLHQTSLMVLGSCGGTRRPAMKVSTPPTLPSSHIFSAQLRWSVFISTDARSRAILHR